MADKKSSDSTPKRNSNRFSSVSSRLISCSTVLNLVIPLGLTQLGTILNSRTGCPCYDSGFNCVSPIYFTRCIKCLPDETTSLGRARLPPSQDPPLRGRCGSRGRSPSRTRLFAKGVLLCGRYLYHFASMTIIPLFFHHFTGLLCLSFSMPLNIMPYRQSIPSFSSRYTEYRYN
jgi:hypothetical protein